MPISVTQDYPHVSIFDLDTESYTSMSCTIPDTNYPSHTPHLLVRRLIMFYYLITVITNITIYPTDDCLTTFPLSLILRRSRAGTVWFYTSTSNKRAARPKLYTKSLTRDLKLMYSCLTLVRISINL